MSAASSLPSFHDFNVATRNVRIITSQMVLNEATKNTYLLQRMLEGMNLDKQIRGGKMLVDQIDGSDGGTYSEYSPGQTESPEITDSLVEVQVPWSFNRDYWGYDEEEDDLNSGDEDRYLDIKKAREQRCLVGVLNGMENQLLALPHRERMEDGQKPRKPLSLLAMVTRDGQAPSSSNGGLAAGSSAWTTIETVNPTIDDWWTNKFATYSAADPDNPDTGVVSQFGRMCRQSMFEMPTALRRYSSMTDDTLSLRKHVIITSDDGQAFYEARLRNINDRMRVVNDPYLGDLQYKGIPILYVSTLDGLGWTTGQPDYIGLNFNYILPFFHKKWFLTQKITDGGSTQPNRHVVWKFVTHNFFLRSRRRQWRISAA